MLKMTIRMNRTKINSEKKYSLPKIIQTLDETFSKMQLLKITDNSDTLTYCDTGNTKDYACFGNIVNALKRQTWFMDNVSEWLLYNSDDSDNPNDFSIEDLLKHYQSNQTMRT